ncbi:magnesium transporter NIPA-domain-containing protein [Cyathus striatus]|nr:magnesium transporter NIPA-domain-containing protein [Cyathus striatus]
MVQDKWIGVSLAFAGSFAIGTSPIITKKGLNDAGRKAGHGVQASDNHLYLRNPIWWVGMSTLALGEVANFAAYMFAPPILVAPLGALSVLIGAILASIFLKERLGHLGRVACTLCALGSIIIVLHAPEDKPIESIDTVLDYAVQPAFLVYCVIVSAYTIHAIFSLVPKYGRTTPIVYISICSLIGSISVMAIKGFGIAVKLTLSGKNQFTYPSTYLFGIVVIVSILMQMHYLNKALDTFPTNLVNPIYYVGFSSATIVASIIFFQGFYNTDAPTSISLIVGFVVTFLGVYLLNTSRSPAYNSQSWGMYSAPSDAHFNEDELALENTELRSLDEHEEVGMDVRGHVYEDEDERAELSGRKAAMSTGVHGVTKSGSRVDV